MRFTFLVMLFLILNRPVTAQTLGDESGLRELIAKEPPRAVKEQCFIPQDKPCTQPDPGNKLCSDRILEPIVEYAEYFENGFLKGYDPVVKYDGCHLLMEDLARDLSSVKDCTDVASRKIEANSRPGEQKGKPCFLRRECKAIAAVSRTPVGWAYYRDANGNDVTSPAPKPTYKAVCQSYAASNDTSAFDTVPSPLEWTECIAHTNCLR